MFLYNYVTLAVPAGTQRWINVESTLRIVDNGYQPYINHISTIDEDGW